MYSILEDGQSQTRSMQTTTALLRQLRGLLLKSLLEE